MKLESERLMPFVGATLPSASGKRVDYRARFDSWFRDVLLEEDKPNSLQLHCLEVVRDRLLLEIQLKLEGPELRRKHQPHLFSTDSEEPLRALIHGLPGTGKSRVIKWICRMFTEVCEWQQGVEFLCVAFQNKVAHAMNGVTLHSAGDLPIGGTANPRKLGHQDINEVFTKNQHLRWLLIDECFMIPDDLLGLFSSSLQAAAVDNLYRTRADASPRPFGGYNVLFFGDMLQIPPIPPSSALFQPPPKETESATTALEMFWTTSEDSINMFTELTEQSRHTVQKR